MQNTAKGQVQCFTMQVEIVMNKFS